MCHPRRCRSCGKTTWAGCGQHVAQVRAQVPDDEWCTGHEPSSKDSWLRRIVGR
jgi:hypothetical protein